MSRREAAETFGANVTRERERQGMSVRALGREATVHRHEVGQLERGERDPRLSTMTRLARALDVPLSDLVAEIAPSAALRSRHG
jgi:transcriptional regulator with XRE-family HTH domain